MRKNTRVNIRHTIMKNQALRLLQGCNIKRLAVKVAPCRIFFNVTKNIVAQNAPAVVGFARPPSAKWWPRKVETSIVFIAPQHMHQAKNAAPIIRERLKNTVGLLLAWHRWLCQNLWAYSFSNKSRTAPPTIKASKPAFL